MIKTGDLREGSFADDDYSKKAAGFEKNGFHVLSADELKEKKNIEIISINGDDKLGANRGGDAFPNK